MVVAKLVAEEEFYVTEEDLSAERPLQLDLNENWGSGKVAQGLRSKDY